MRKASLEVTFDHFFYWNDVYIDLLNKVIDKKSPFTTKTEKAEVIEGLALKMCSIWEVLVRDIMVDCLNRDSGQYADYMDLRLPRHIPRPQCFAMIVGLGYFDFKSYDDVKQKAKRILVDEFNPFSSVKKSVSDKIDEFFTMRNYIAHYSHTGERSLKKLYQGVYKLTKFRQPGDFLLSIDQKTKSPRMQAYINAFAAATTSMQERLGMEPE